MRGLSNSLSLSLSLCLSLSLSRCSGKPPLLAIQGENSIWHSSGRPRQVLIPHVTVITTHVRRVACASLDACSRKRLCSTSRAERRLNAWWLRHPLDLSAAAEVLAKQRPRAESQRIGARGMAGPGGGPCRSAPGLPATTRHATQRHFHCARASSSVCLSSANFFWI